MPRLRDSCRFLAVNLAFRLVPNADLLYAADSGFWHVYKGAREFAGVKVSAQEAARVYDQNIRVVTVPAPRLGARFEQLIEGPVGTLGNGGGNSGFQALNLAVQLGARVILLAGLDFAGKHWHDDHPPTLRNPSAERLAWWRRHFDGAAPALEQMGVTVLNLSTVSALKAFPYVEPERVAFDPRPTTLQARGALGRAAGGWLQRAQ